MEITIRPGTTEELDEKCGEDQDACWGFYHTDHDTGRHEVVYSPILKGAALRSLLLHELCHAWLAHTGISDLIGSEKLEEFIVCQFALAVPLILEALDGK